MNNSENKNIHKKFIALAIGTALLFTAFFGVVLTSGLDLGDTANAENTETLTKLAAQASTANDLDSPFKTVYNEVSQSVVGVQINTQRYSMNGRIHTESSFVGSGVVIDSDNGYVVTNYHVVTAGGSEVSTDISIIYNEETYSAKFIAGDSSADVALLQVENLNAPAVKLGNSDELSIGDWALVVGNPLGENFTNTLTVGVISGLDRDMTTQTRTGKTGTSMIQTDAAINSGNSGGGMFNIRGELVGITSMKMSNNGAWGSASIEGFGFAIPINTVVDVADELLQYGEVRTPKIGVGIEQMVGGSDEPTKDSLPNSIWVTSVETGSPADNAGIKVNDLIVEADGERVRTISELQNIVQSHKFGETVEITVYRIPRIESIKENEDYPEGEYITFQIELVAYGDKE